MCFLDVQVVEGGPDSRGQRVGDSWALLLFRYATSASFSSKINCDDRRGTWDWVSLHGVLRAPRDGVHSGK